MDPWDTLPMDAKTKAKMNELSARSTENQLASLAGSAIFFGIFSIFLRGGFMGIGGIVMALMSLGAGLGVFIQTMLMDGDVRPLVSRQLVLAYLIGAVFGGLIGLFRLALTFLS